MKFIKLILTNGQEVEINRDLIKAIMPLEGRTPAKSHRRVFQIDLVGGNPPLEFEGEESSIQKACDRHELQMRLIPLVTSALMRNYPEWSETAVAAAMVDMVNAIISRAGLEGA